MAESPLLYPPAKARGKSNFSQKKIRQICTNPHHLCSNIKNAFKKNTKTHQIKFTNSLPLFNEANHFNIRQLFHGFLF